MIMMIGVFRFTKTRKLASIQNFPLITPSLMRKSIIDLAFSTVAEIVLP